MSLFTLMGDGDTNPGLCIEQPSIFTRATVSHDLFSSFSFLFSLQERSERSGFMTNDVRQGSRTGRGKPNALSQHKLVP